MIDKKKNRSLFVIHRLPPRNSSSDTLHKIVNLPLQDASSLFRNTKYSNTQVLQKNIIRRNSSKNILAKSSITLKKPDEKSITNLKFDAGFLGNVSRQLKKDYMYFKFEDIKKLEYCLR